MKPRGTAKFIPEKNNILKQSTAAATVL